MRALYNEGDSIKVRCPLRSTKAQLGPGGMAGNANNICLRRFQYCQKASSVGTPCPIVGLMPMVHLIVWKHPTYVGTARE